jgi:hypothetical protein
LPDDTVLEEAVATLNRLIEAVRELGLRDSEQFLAMARLHLLMDLNEVSDREFRMLCDVLEGKAKMPARSRGARAAGRTRRDAEMRLMRRAWKCSEASRRDGRKRVRQ